MKRRGNATDLVRAAPPPQPEGELVAEHEFPSDPTAKTEALESLLAVLLRARAVPPDLEQRVRLCLDEGLANAVMHGNRNDPARSVRVRLFMGKEQWSVLIEDHGKGFKEEDLPDPQAPENLLEESGRGVHLMQSLMDEVRYWRGGSALLMKMTIRS